MGVVAVNVSPLQFSRPDFVDIVSQVLAHTDLEPQLLELEVTESVLIRDIEESIRCAAALTSLGVKVALDDFGSGYSSLGYLHRIPIVNLKLDQSFVHDIGQAGKSEAIIGSIVALARTLRIQTTLEGIENEAQLQVARKAGCDRVQGYLLGKPVAASELTAFVSERAATETRGLCAIALPHPQVTGIGRDLLLGDSGPLPTWPEPRVRMACGKTLRAASW